MWAGDLIFVAENSVGYDWPCSLKDIKLASLLKLLASPTYTTITIVYGMACHRYCRHESTNLIENLKRNLQTISEIIKQTATSTCHETNLFARFSKNYLILFFTMKSGVANFPPLPIPSPYFLQQSPLACHLSVSILFEWSGSTQMLGSGWHSDSPQWRVWSGQQIDELAWLYVLPRIWIKISEAASSI